MRHPRNAQAGLVGDTRITSRVFRHGSCHPLSCHSSGTGCLDNVTRSVVHDPDECFNAPNASRPGCCLGRCLPSRGSCVRGVCLCLPGWRGFDCHEASPLATSPDRMTPKEGRGFVFVHAPPPELGLHNMRRFQCRVNSYDADYHLLRRLLLDRSARSFKLEDASLFYVPTWAAFSYGNTAVNLYGLVTDLLVAWLRGGEFRSHWEANRTRYVMYYTGDKGACGVPDYGQIQLAHWGLTTPWDQQLSPFSWSPQPNATHPCRFDKSVRCASRRPCFQRPRDTLMPFYASWDPSSSEAPAPAEWECQLFFAGSRTHGKFAPEYSQGVRQAVFDAHANRSGYCIRAKAPVDLWHRSRFCLAPGGNGFGDRLTRAMRTGCVPVIIQPGVAMPLDDLLPYDQFSLSFNFSDIEGLHTKLEAVSAAEHARLRVGVRQFAAAFNWHEEHGKAYEYARYALCLRAGIRCHSFKPERGLGRQRGRGGSGEDQTPSAIASMRHGALMVGRSPSTARRLEAAAAVAAATMLGRADVVAP